MNSRYRIFISYSHKDEAFKDELQEHLRGLPDGFPLEFWEDRQIEGGDEWRPKIEAAINACHLAILMVSPAFLASGFIRNEELPRIFNRRASQGARMQPIVIRSCNWMEHSTIQALQARPKDGNPMARFPAATDDRAAAWTAVVKEIIGWARDQPLLPSAGAPLGGEPESSANALSALLAGSGGRAGRL